MISIHSHMARSVLITLSLLLACGCRTTTKDSAEYPTRPVSFVVPWNPGGGTDTASRALASILPEYLGQPVNVINRTGGGGVVGHLAIAQARPDGYTIGAVTVEITMMHWMGLTDLAFGDYTPLALVMDNPAAVTVRADAAWNTVGELISDLREAPGTYMASGTSKGGIWDLARIGFLEAAGLPEQALPWVPSQGAAPALQELLAGGVHVVTAALAETDALRQAGQVKVLAVMADERLERAPDIPTLKELGIDWSLGGWVGVGAPAGIPSDVKRKLAASIQEAFADSNFTRPLERAGFNLVYRDTTAFTSFIAAQDQRNGVLLKSAGIARQ